MARTDPAVNITGAQVSLSEDQRARTRRYLFSMSLRTICFILAVLFTGWMRWAFVLGAIFLPYIAVVMANAGRRRSRAAKPSIILLDQQTLPGSKHEIG